MTLRKALTFLQFTAALVVFITAALLYRQVTYMSEAEGITFRTEGLVHVDLQGVPYEPFRQEAQKLQGVERVGAASHVPLSGIRNTGVGVELDRFPESVTAQSYAVDYEFVEALNLPFIATGEWSETRFESGQAVLISETAAHRFGFKTPQAALGEPLTVSRFGTTREVHVVGVVRDIYLSLSEAPGHPIVFQYAPSRFRTAMVQVGEGQSQTVIEALGAVWSQFDAGDPLQAQTYRALISSTGAVTSLKDLGWILGFVAGLAVLISSLGLLGIATYEVQTRTREIGIRKALGASVASVAWLLSKDVMWLIGAAIALGVPLAWQVNQFWLEDLAYRIDLGLGTFMLSAAAVMLLALLALTPQATRVAHINPAETLREE